VAGPDVVVITGAGGGMGLECVAAFAGRGHLVVSDVSEDRVGEALAAARAAGAPATGAVCDATDEAAVAGLFATVADTGTLRSLVHTVGLSPTMAEGRRVLEVDLVGAARGRARATARHGPPWS